MGARVPANAWLVVLCPFAAGYYLSFFYRNVNAVIARDLAHEFSLSPSDLGFLTSMYLLSFAAVQLPLGVFLDRYGPRRVVATLLVLAALGALTFGLAPNFGALALARALIGIGVSAALMGALKAITLWFPRARIATANGLVLSFGGLGALSATAPAEALLGTIGWRGLFYAMSAVSLAVAAVIFAIVPEKKLPGSDESFGRQLAAFGVVFRSEAFLRIGAAMVLSHAGYLALQGLWLAPWLQDVAGRDRAGAANLLFVTALGYTFGSAFFGALADRLGRYGISPTTVFKAGLCLTFVTFLFIASGVRAGLPVVLFAYGFCSISVGLAYAIFTPLFGPAMVGRVLTASNVLMFTCSFAVQWGIGGVLRLFPAIDGRYSPEGYSTALFLLAGLQALAIAWLLPMKTKA